MKSILSKVAKVLAVASLGLVSACATFFSADKVVCEGTYGGHLQGVATDGESVYWSFTVEVVKTDLSGRILATSGAVPRHQGDCCVKDGVLYVAVNLGKFNQETQGVSEVWAYDTRTLQVKRTWKLPEMGHGAGGMTYAGDRFFVIGGLPATHERNYVYEYDADFHFVKRHDLQTGFTLMGIQTAAFEDGRFLFGIYGCVGDPSGILECPRDLSSFVRREGPGSVGVLKQDGDYWTARTARADGPEKKFTGSLVRSPGYPQCEKVYAPAWTGKGQVHLFYEGQTPTGWKDAGYSLRGDGYRPLCNPRGPAIYTKVSQLKKTPVLPAVGIGGDRAYSAPDLVRAVRRVAERDEVLALHVPGTSADAAEDARLQAALAAVRAEAEKLGVQVVVR